MAENTKRLGRAALDKLELLIDALDESRRRGKLDILANNNPLVTRWKRKKIKESETAAIEAKEAVREFRDALREDQDADLNTQEFLDDTKAIDYFLGSIGAIVVQKRIVANIEEVRRVHRAVSDALDLLEGLR